MIITSIIISCLYHEFLSTVIINEEKEIKYIPKKYEISRNLGTFASRNVPTHS